MDHKNFPFFSGNALRCCRTLLDSVEKNIIHKEHTQSEIIVVVIMLWSKYKDGGRESCLNYIKTYASSPPLLLIWHPHSQPMCMRSPCLQNKEQRG